MTLTSPRFAKNVLLRRASDNNPPLARGSVSEAVRLVQQALIDLRFHMPRSTQRFGSPTEFSVTRRRVSWSPSSASTP
jgi:hypothetical protein